MTHNNEASNALNAYNIGTFVRSTITGDIGVISYSTYGAKVEGFKPDGSRWKTAGAPLADIAEYWEVIEDGE